MHVVLSLAFGLGLYLIFRWLAGGQPEVRPDEDPNERPAGRAGWIARRLASPGADGVGLRELAPASAAAGAASALLSQLFFGWPVVTLAAAGAGLLLPTWYYRQRAQRRRGEIEEAVGEAVETLRDAVRIGLGVEEALRALAVTGPQALRPVFSGVERDLRLAGFEEALEQLEGS